MDCVLCAGVFAVPELAFILRKWQRANKRADGNGHNEGDGGGHCPLREACSEGQRGGEVCDQETAYCA